MSNPSPSSNGKGSARRPEDLSKIRDNWDQIDWSKGRSGAPKCRCGQPGEEEHTCPYGEEINGSDALCNYCTSCQHECCMDI